MTQSELFAVMCGGLASVAGSVLAGYAQMGVPLEYLIAASFMAAPGGLLFAKLMVPETEQTHDKVDATALIAEEDRPANVIDAAASGAASGMQLALNVGAMLLAFIALIALLNGILGDWRLVRLSATLAGIDSGLGVLANRLSDRRAMERSNGGGLLYRPKDYR